MGCNAKPGADSNSGRMGRFARYIVLFFVKMVLAGCPAADLLRRYAG